ncbi:YlbN-like protein [Staphylococcus gallinarum]|uniref:YlbN-like protein n=1 Tax=Staphylococcus gallinarum TaxID=1293 RepID=A0A380FGF8_STAGA|nr:YlbN-like protein [Staphylococcus gallinarum]
MKWSITQLRKFQDKPFEFNQTVNFDHLVKSLDLIDLSEINVDGELTVKSNEVIADMHVTGTYTMACCAYVSSSRSSFRYQISRSI